ncbi:peptide MFS transporter [Leyella stercorea]|jgi:POT family proton-dependent oligopeptide transporter|uniref:peptide MFS transporter n=2 Tax=Leyella stercorea TaxID=363265 RepID=UPI00241EE028|nr:peptide MFS transporter [Leyella stercorea]
MFENQPKGLWALALANTGERFGYYTMLAVFLLYLQANFGYATGTASTIYSTFLMMVYFLPIIGGIAADKFGFGKMVTSGIFIMFIGYLVLSLPLGKDMVAAGAMGLALVLIAFGTGLFKGNLQVMVGRLYDEPKYAQNRDSGFSLFYMAINIGAMFAPTAAIKIMDWAQTSLGVSVEDSYHFAFAVACASLIVSIAIYYIFGFTYKHVLASETKKKDDDSLERKDFNELSPAETKERIVCLCLVFAVVIFFWMAFHQNGATLTLFARDYTLKTSEGLQSMAFDVRNLVACIFVVYASFGLAQSKTFKGKLISLGVIVAAISYLFYAYNALEGAVDVKAPIFQQFNPCYVVALTPVSVAIFSWLNKIGKEPTSPEKIGLGMLVAALGFVWMAVGSMGLELPLTQGDHATEGTRVSANLLISTYLILTFAELLLSPIGISFVTKVAPPKYAGLMMGLWFGATAIGNQLVMLPGIMWGQNLSLVTIWGVLAGICLLSAVFIFSIIKKLNKVS